MSVALSCQETWQTSGKVMCNGVARHISCQRRWPDGSSREHCRAQMIERGQVISVPRSISRSEEEVLLLISGLFRI